MTTTLHLLRAAALAAAALLCAPGLPESARAQQQPPGADGVETKPFLSQTLLVGTASLHFTLALPAGWLASHDGNSTVFEPETRTPTGDLGALVMLDAVADAPELARPDALLPLLADGILQQPRETARENITITADGAPLDATLFAIEARFDNGRPARFLALHAVHGEVVLVALAGADDDAFAPWDATLRELLLSLTLASGPATPR